MCLTTLVALWLAAGPVSAQTARQPDVTAAFLLNFARFTEWPAEALPADAPLTFCVSDPAVADALEQSVRAHPIESHPAQVVRFSNESAPRGCALIYASGLDDRRMTELLDPLRGASVLLVGDADQFEHRGGIIRLFVEGEHMKFVVNLAAADRAHLRLSARLLKLATVVRD